MTAPQTGQSFKSYSINHSLRMCMENSVGEHDHKKKAGSLFSSRAIQMTATNLFPHYSGRRGPRRSRGGPAYANKGR
jgi:hypothetical protein